MPHYHEEGETLGQIPDHGRTTPQPEGNTLQAHVGKVADGERNLSYRLRPQPAPAGLVARQHAAFYKQRTVAITGKAARGASASRPSPYDYGVEVLH